jgi:hypothetical protein
MPKPLENVFTIPFRSKEAAQSALDAYRGKGSATLMEAGGVWVVRIVEPNKV